MFTYVDQNWSNRICRAPEDRNNGATTASSASRAASHSPIENEGPRPGESLFNWVVRTTREQAEAMQEKDREKWIN